MYTLANFIHENHRDRFSHSLYMLEGVWKDSFYVLQMSKQKPYYLMKRHCISWEKRTGFGGFSNNIDLILDELENIL